MPLYEVDVTETVAYHRRYIVEADNALAAHDRAEVGETVGEETLKTEGVVNRVVQALKPYQGPRYVVEQVVDDPEYWHVVDTLSGDITDICSSESEAREAAESYEQEPDE